MFPGPGSQGCRGSERVPTAGQECPAPPCPPSLQDGALTTPGPAGLGPHQSALQQPPRQHFPRTETLGHVSLGSGPGTSLARV